jgi:hypothetical protein
VAALALEGIRDGDSTYNDNPQFGCGDDSTSDCTEKSVLPDP